ncbi:NAD(P)/FAD-dependent oxidoreductase [Shewanella waksmanii]|uniref:NAD(P)/FAD-dependent oxidoreductase n=1 Tax=Shewanella waksmanii TaxID=213783 RepID=UPI0004ADA648|nr:FAD-binding oxidoreductase [Shewanella waksmanii]
MNYDPLHSTHPANQDWPSSYWSSTVSQPKPLDSITGTQSADVVVIGAGYTGMLTAHYLASQFDVDCIVLEANQVGFGASGRNAGFVLKGSGRLGYGQMAKRWGIDVAKGIYREFTQAVERVDDLISEHQIACEPQQTGYLKIAHNPKHVHKLQSAADFIANHLGGQAEFIESNRFKQEFMDHQQAFGAMRYDDGFGINPLKLALGYKQMLIDKRVAIYERSPVIEWQQTAKGHVLTTPDSQIVARHVVSAGNAYTPKKFNPLIDRRYLPILSNVIVTEVLSDEQLAKAGLHTHQVAMDTRLLKYYYRLLPDNRILFGGRGAVTGADSNNPKYAQRLYRAMLEAFPTLSSTSIAYSWTGWIAAALDDMPHIYSQDHTSYSLGYCGAGVSFSAQAAQRIAQSIVGEAIPQLPLYQQPLPKFPFSRLRRVGQRGYYHYAWLMDRYR